MEEYLFFKHHIIDRHGNKYFKNRKLFNTTFVEDYLSRNNRALNNFMTRLFVLAPNLVNCRGNNIAYRKLREDWIIKNQGKTIKKIISVPWSNETEIVEYKRRWKEDRGSGLYVSYYRRLWNKFLKENVDDSLKKVKSPFRKGEKYEFSLRNLS